MKLLVNALTKFLSGIFLVGAMLFWPAGGFDYLNGWLFCGLLFVPMLILGAVLFVKSPDLLRKRLDSREKEKTQQGVIAWSGLFFFVGFVLAGLDHRFGWSHVPTWLVIAAAAILLISYALYAEVMRENAYLSRKVEVQEGQHVVDTGLYGIVRHPMYAVTLWLFLSIPLVLGSWYALICFAVYPILIVVRLLNEEKVLTEGLEGYAEYKKKVRYRLIPFIW
jgi:protein-S-isoprenylcysteine O-methyltransferase Ste14